MKEDEEVVIDSNTSLLVETLEKRWKTYRSELKRCQKQPGEEAIHDMRVATRRLLALVDMLRAVSPHPRLGKLRRAFKKQLDALDDLRDTQVMLLEITGRLDDLPDLRPFQEYLAKKEKRLLRSAAKGIKSLKSGRSKKRIESARKALLKAGDKNRQQKTLLEIVDDAYKNALRRYQRIEPAQAGTIHRLRIAFKKFRYMVEIVHPLIPNFPEDNFKQMHAYQGMMGDIQDLEVFVSAFDDFAGKDAPYDPEPVRQFYKQRHSEAINAFIEDKQQLDTFWRPAPESPFAWDTRGRRKKITASKKTAEPLPGQKKDENGEQVEVEQEA